MITLWLLSSYSFIQLIFKITTICTNFHATMGFCLFLRILAFASQTIKIITTFTFTFLITHFNFTQLLFWILALLDLSFPGVVKKLFCILFVHCHLHILRVHFIPVHIHINWTFISARSPLLCKLNRFIIPIGFIGCWLYIYNHII